MPSLMKQKVGIIQYQDKSRLGFYDQYNESQASEQKSRKLWF